MNNLSTYLNDIYYQYLLIEEKAYSEKINYVEHNLEYIHKLEGNVRVEVMYNYCLALYESKRYNKTAQILDELINDVIIENIVMIGDQDIYQSLLFLKGHTQLSDNNLTTAKHIFSELIKINPTEEKYKEALIQTNKQENQKEAQFMRALSMLLLMSSGLVIGIELLLVRPFCPEIVQPVEWTRILLFIVGALSILGYFLFCRMRNKKIIAEVISKRL